MIPGTIEEWKNALKESKAAMNMVEVGNGFERALGLAMIAGSDEQRGRIEAAFPEILARYAPVAFPDDLAPPFGPDHPFVISPDQVGL